MNSHVERIKSSGLFFRNPLPQENAKVKKVKIGRNRIWVVLGLVFVLALAVTLISPAPALADGQYSAVFFSPDHPGDEYTVYFDTLEDLLAYFEEHSIEANIEGLDPETEAIVFYANYAGLPIDLQLPRRLPRNHPGYSRVGNQPRV